MFECNITVSRGGLTVWKGTAFDCAHSNNEIHLLHSRLNATGICNDGAVVARLGVHDGEDSLYISQLNISINYSTSVINKTVECVYDNGVLSNLTVGCHTLSSRDLISCKNFSGEKGTSL